MKKFLFLTVIFTSLFFSGCFFQSFLSSGHSSSPDDSSTNTKGKKIAVDSDGEVYIIKLNTSDEWINARDTGSFKVNGSGLNSSCRSIIYDKTNTSQNISDSNDFFDGDSFIRQQNLKILEELKNKKSAERAAGTSRNIVQGIDTTDYSKKSKTQYFYCMTDTSGKETLLEADLMYTGEHCYVYGDKDNNKSEKTKLTQENYENLGKKFDEIYELEVEVIGNPIYTQRDSDYFCKCNEKIFLFVSDLYRDSDKNGNTLGYFYQKDLYNNDIYNTSNEKEILYFDANWLQKDEKMVCSTLTHEFNHLINYVTKFVNYYTKYDDLPDVENNDTTYKWTWLTEMLAMTTEDMFQTFLEIEDISSPKARLGDFYSNYNFGFKDWYWFNKMYNEGRLTQSQFSKYQLITYANTYTFGAYLARNYGGVKLISEIAQNEYIGEESITKALQKVNPEFYYTAENGDKVLIDFDFVLKKFCMCLINMKEPSVSDLTNFGDNYYITLNRSSGSSEDILYFTPINNIKKEVINGETKTSYVYGKPNLRNYDDQTDLPAKSFSINYLGTNISEFIIYPSTYSDIKYYMITMD